MSTQDLSPEQLKASDQIIKLLNLAAKAGTPEEAAAAAAKAQELLAKHNLDAATLEDPKAVRREQAAVEGGSYAFERDLWRAVAELNFCMYWNQQYLTAEPVMTDIYAGQRYVGRGLKRLRRRRHAVVGRMVNTRSTIAMATYLRGAIERVLDERLKGQGVLKQSNWSWSFRKGVAATIVDKLQDRREELLKAEASQVRKMMDEAAAAASSEISASTQLTLAAHSKNEEDANADFLHGEGWSAKQALQRAERAERQRLMYQSYTAWAAANPKLAQSKFEWKDPKTGRVYWYAPFRRGSTGSSTRDDGVDYGAYKAGQAAGESIGLDVQAEDKKGKQGRITGSKDIHL